MKALRLSTLPEQGKEYGIGPEYQLAEAHHRENWGILAGKSSERREIMVFSDAVVGLWIVVALFLIGVVGGGLWFVFKSRSVPLRSDTPANDGEQRHDEFITDSGSGAPPPQKKKTI
jgi:hypothetical protein